MIRSIFCHGRPPDKHLLRSLRRRYLHQNNQDGKSPLERFSNRFRSLMRCVPHALTILSSVPERGAPPRGLLVSSFNSVTISPIPYVSFNIKVPSSTLDAVDASRHFTASIIDDPYTADVFAGMVRKDEKLWEQMLEPDGSLKEGCGGLVWMKCVWEARRRLDVGDHAIIVGEVVDAGQYSDTRPLDESAMVYWSGTYTGIGGKNAQVKPGTRSLPQQQERAPIRYSHLSFDDVRKPYVRTYRYDVKRSDCVELPVS